MLKQKNILHSKSRGMQKPQHGSALMPNFCPRKEIFIVISVLKANATTVQVEGQGGIKLSSSPTLQAYKPH